MSISLINRAVIFSLALLVAASCTDPRIKQIEQFELQYLDARKKGDVAKAIAITRLIQRLDPNEVAHLDTLALLYLELGEFESALSVADSAIQLIPIVSTVRVATTCTKQLKHYLDGEEYTHLLLRLGEPESAELMFDLAWFQFHSRQYEKCVLTLNQILNVPEYRYALRREGVMLEGREVFVNMSLFAVCYNMIGASEYQTGAKEKATKAFQMALEIDPNYVAAAENLQVSLSN